MTPRILLADDEPIIRRTLVRALESRGHTVVAAVDGDAAVAALAQDAFDLVITDLSLGGHDGWQVLARAKARDPDTSVLVMSGLCGAEGPGEALRAGADDFMAKPCDIDELLLRAERCLELSRLRRELRAGKRGG